MEINQDDVQTSGMPDSRGESDTLCLVCGDPSSGIHYGISTCNPCKSFFYRTLRFRSQYICRGNKNCSIRNYKRKPCQWCRFKKCLEAGMTKEGMNKMELYFTLNDDFLRAGMQKYKPELLPPCRVCQDRATGFHYGVNSCDACKGFFHRALQFNSRFRCIGNRNCDVRHGVGTVCKWCRYNKCLAVGMSKKASKTGRKTRRKDNLELKGIKDRMTSSFSETQENFISSTKGDLFSIDSGSDNQESQTSSVASSSEVDQQEIMDTTTASPPPCLSFTVPADVKEVGLIAVRKSPISKSNISTRSHDSNNKQLFTAYSSTLHRNTGPSQSHKSRKHAVALTSLPLPESAAKQNFVCEEGLKSGRIMELYKNEAAVLKCLVDAHRHAFDDFEPDCSQHNAFKEAQEHYESCRARREMFGNLVRLSDEEHDMVFRETGVDVDGRQKFATEYEETLENFIRKMCMFCRAIPGFTKLDLTEKASLIREGRLECSLLCNYTVANTELGVIRTHGHQWICVHDHGKFPGISEDFDLKPYLNICKRLQSLKLCAEERVLLKALNLAKPDHCKSPSSSLRLIHKNISRMLVNHIGKRHDNPQIIFSEILEMLTEFSKTEGDIICLIKKLNLNKYSLVERNLPRVIMPDHFWY